MLALKTHHRLNIVNTVELAPLYILRPLASDLLCGVSFRGYIWGGRFDKHIEE